MKKKVIVFKEIIPEDDFYLCLLSWMKTKSMLKNFGIKELHVDVCKDENEEYYCAGFIKGNTLE